jgi:hypothetical protein
MCSGQTTTYNALSSNPLQHQLKKKEKNHMEGWLDPAAMAPSWPPPAPLLSLHECHGNLVSAPCTSPLSCHTTTGQTSMTVDQKSFTSKNSTTNYYSTEKQDTQGKKRHQWLHA